MVHKLTDDMTWEEIVEKTYKECGTKDTGFKTWMQSKKGLGGYFFGGPSHWLYCYNVMKKITNDSKRNDHVEVIFGQEGSGKSTLGLQRACMVDPTFCKERLIHSRLDLVRWYKRNKGRTAGKAILIDEGNLLFFNRESQTSGAINIIKFFQLCRQTRTYFIICIPDYTTIDPYLRKTRIDALTHITKNHSKFSHYNKKGKDIINSALNKSILIFDIKVPVQYLFKGYWNKFIPKMNDITEETYLELKDNAWGEFLDDTERKLSEVETGELYIPVAKAMKLTGISRRETIIKLIKEGKIDGKQIGKRYFVYKPKLIENVQRGPDSGTIILPNGLVRDDAAESIET